MLFTRRAAFAATVAVSVFTPYASAHDYKVGALSIGHPWARATPPSAQVGAGYLSISNTGSEPDRLISAKFSGSTTVELHEMSHEGGVMRMRELPQGIEIKPGEKLELKPGGLHLMFMGLKAGLKEGELLKGELVFLRAGRIEVDFKVENIGARGDDGHHHGRATQKAN